jgi:hypothetical protein
MQTFCPKKSPRSESRDEVGEPTITYKMVKIANDLINFLLFLDCYKLNDMENRLLRPKMCMICNVTSTFTGYLRSKMVHMHIFGLNN